MNKSRPQTFTPNDYLVALKQNRPLPITQQINNFYKTYNSQSKSTEGPRIDLKEFSFDGVASDGALLWHSDAVNGGATPALDLEGSVKWMIGPRNESTEDALFEFLYRAAGDEVQPRADQPPGRDYYKTEPITVRLSGQDALKLQSGGVLYLGRLDTYKDSHGSKYVSELCMFHASPTAPTLSYCDGHNKTRKLGNR